MGLWLVPLLFLQLLFCLHALFSFFWFFFSVLLKVVSSQDFILRAQNILSRFVLLRGPLYVGNSTLPRVSFTISAIPIEKQCYISLQVISKKIIKKIKTPTQKLKIKQQRCEQEHIWFLNGNFFFFKWQYAPIHNFNNAVPMTRPTLGLRAWLTVANEWAGLLLLSSSGFQTGPISHFPATTRNKNGLTQNGPSRHHATFT